jgi:hypothetical protein
MRNATSCEDRVRTSLTVQDSIVIRGRFGVYAPTRAVKENIPYQALIDYNLLQCRRIPNRFPRFTSN